MAYELPVFLLRLTVMKPELQSRFLRAVYELQVLGLIKKSARKKGYVQKLVYS